MGRKRHIPTRNRPQLQAKANPAYLGIATGFSDLPKPVEMSKAYKSFAKEGFGSNNAIFKCCRYIMQNGGAIPPKLYTDATMEKEIKKHALLDKLNHPNNEQTGVDYREAVIGYFLIAANSYQFAIRKGGTSGPPDELWTLEPDKVKVLASKTRGIAGYEYADFDAPIPAENIGRLKSWNPNSPVYGMSPIEVGAILIDQMSAANKWNLALMQNSGKPSGVWTAPVAMSKPDRDSLEAKVNGKYGGVANAGKTPVLDAGLTWTKTSESPTDVDWLNVMRYNAAALANLYDISPQLIGDTSSSTYDNMEQAKVASYTEAIFPALDKLYALWNMWLLPMYPDLANGAYLYYDKDSVEVIQKMIQAQKDSEAKRAVSSYMQGACTLNQALELQGLPDLGDAGNVFRLGGVLIPADKLQEYAKQSLVTPAGPPKLGTEPLDVSALPGAPTPTTTPPEGTPPLPQPAPKPDDAEPPPKPAKKSRERNIGEPTHMLWICAASACPFCVENDGVLISLADSSDEFPNGCTGPDDCHRFCKCSAVELSIPPDTDISAYLDITDDGSDLAELLSGFAVGYIASRHDRDVAARDAQQDDEGDDEDTKSQDITALQDRRRRREEFRKFREQTLG